MKKRILRAVVLLQIVLLALATQSCGGEKKNSENRNESGEIMQEADNNSDGAKRMQLSSREYTATLAGKSYSIHITRRPDDNLPVVKSEMGSVYKDNSITLSIKQDSRVVIEREFTKADFASLLDGDFMKNAVLDGMVYSKTSGGAIVLAASACYPQTDLCIPMIISVTPDGAVSMAKSEQLEDDYEGAEQ